MIPFSRIFIFMLLIVVCKSMTTPKGLNNMTYVMFHLMLLRWKSPKLSNSQHISFYTQFMSSSNMQSKRNIFQLHCFSSTKTWHLSIAQIYSQLFALRYFYVVGTILRRFLCVVQRDWAAYKTSKNVFEICTDWQVYSMFWDQISV